MHTIISGLLHVSSLIDWLMHTKFVSFNCTDECCAVVIPCETQSVTRRNMWSVLLQDASRRLLSTAERPLPGHPESQQGTLQEALPLPALVAPALAAANQDQAYLRWKAVIHSMLSTTAAAAHGPDFRAARWFHNQMSYRDGSAAVPSNQGRWIRRRFCCCLR